MGGIGSDTLTVTGGGAAGALTVTQQVRLQGDYRIGALTVAGTLELGPQPSSGVAVVATSSLLVATGGSLNLAQTALSVAGRATLLGVMYERSGSSVQAGSLVLNYDTYALPTVFVDPTSRLEVGTAGGAAMGDITVDRGATLSGSATLEAGAVINNGTIVAEGQLGVWANITGSGQLQITARSDLAVYGVAAGQTIDFAGAEARLDVLGYPTFYTFGSGWIAPGVVLDGFVAGDVIAFRDGIVSGRLATIPGGESLLLTDVNEQVETLTLRGATDATSYLLLQTADATLVVAVASDAGAGRAGPGTAARDTYVWTGALGPDWGSAGNWQDTTQGGTATIAPGRHDDVTIAALPYGPAVVTGVGRTDTLTIAGSYGPSLILDGRFAVRMLTGTGTLIDAGASSVVTAAILNASALSLDIDGGALRAGAVLGGRWTLLDGASVQVGHADTLESVFVDAGSRFEVGTAGHAEAGVFTVDAGASVSGLWSIEASVVDNGTMRCDTPFNTIGGELSGAGRIVLGDADMLRLGYGLSGVTVDFAGQNAVLELGQPGTVDPTGFTLADFAPTDAVFFQNVGDALATIRAVYSPGAGDHGTLRLIDTAGNTLGAIGMIGSYAGDTFLISHTGGYYDSLTVLPPAETGQPGPGTPGPTSFRWAGGLLQGSWGNAANWIDTGTNQGAAVAPGVHNTVTIDGAFAEDYPAAPLVILGVGQADTISIAGGVVLDGGFQADALDFASLTVSGNGSIVTAATLDGSVFGSDDLIVSGAEVRATTIANLGNTSVEFGGVMTAAALSVDGTVFVDATSSLRVGTTDAAATAGALTVAAGATASVVGTIDGNLIADGTVSSYYLNLFGSLDGSGQVMVGSSGLFLYGGAASTVGIDLTATDAPLFLADAADAHATISGFAAGDTISLEDINDIAKAQYAYEGSGLGTLTLSDAAGSAIYALQLDGDYRGAAFLLTSSTDAGTVIGLAGAVSPHTG